MARRSSSRARGGQVLRVRALVLDQLADGLVGFTVEVEHPGDGLVEQVEVVADDEQGAPVVAQEVEQPVAGVGVEVVGGLVEQEQVAAAEQDAGQLEAPALAAGERAEGHVEPVGRRPRPSTSWRTSDSAAYPPSISKRSCARDNWAKPIVRTAPPPQLLEPVGGLVEPPARQHVGQAVGVVGHGVLAGVLRQVAGVAGRWHPGLVGQAPQHLEQRGLAGAVAAHEADLVTGAQGEGGALDDEGAADLHRGPADRQHGRPSWQPRSTFRTSVNPYDRIRLEQRAPARHCSPVPRSPLSSAQRAVSTSAASDAPAAPNHG